MIGTLSPTVTSASATAETALAKLDGVTGLPGVKDFVHSMVATLDLDRQRRDAGLKPLSDSSLHMIFAGNPGTGKTTIARVVADILRSLGVLRVGHLVEADRSSLVAGYVGQTAIKTHAVVQSALGGVLFIDEAYSLVSDAKDTFGREALDTLIKLVEGYRDDLVVILAGYENQMADFQDADEYRCVIFEEFLGQSVLFLEYWTFSTTSNLPKMGTQ